MGFGPVVENVLVSSGERNGTVSKGRAKLYYDQLCTQTPGDHGGMAQGESRTVRAQDQRALPVGRRVSVKSWI